MCNFCVRGRSAEFLRWIGLLLSCGIFSAFGAPTIQWTQPAAESTVAQLDQITVEFDEPISGVQVGSLRLDGVAASALSILSSWQYSFQFTAAVPGNHQISWSPDLPVRSVRDGNETAVPPPWTNRVLPQSGAAALQITKFMADNKSSLKDQDGDNSPWIEVYNPTAKPVSLRDWSLVTNVTAANGWRFPNYLLESGEQMIVFASGKNRTNVSNELHTDFRLKKLDGYLGLLDPSGFPLSEFGPGYLVQRADVPFGRDLVSPELTGYFPGSSPGNLNLSSGVGFAGAIGFSQGSQSFVTQLSVRLTCPTAGAVIRYTLDQSLPTVSSPAYSGEILLTTSMLVRARAFAPGLLPGLVRSETYTRIQPALASTVATLPTIVIYNFGAGVPSIDINAHPQRVNLALYQPVGGRLVLTNPPDFNVQAKLSVHGSSTRGLPKQSWSIHFQNEFDGDQSVSPLGMPSNSRWILYAPNNFEPVLMHNPLAYRLSNEVGRYAPRTRFVVVYMATTAGSITTAAYNGIYVLEEEIHHGSGRVDIPRPQPLDNQQPQVTGGYLLKIDRLGPGENGLSAANQQIAFVDPSESTIRAPERLPQYQYISQYLRNFGAALYGTSYRDPLKGYAAYLDVPAWIDHHILNVVTFNVDALRLSAFFYKPRQGKLFFGPVWDFDRTQGSTDGRDFNPRIWRSLVSDQGTDFFNYLWWDRLFRDIDFWQRWIDRYQGLREDVLSTNHVNAVIDEFADQLRKEQPKEVSRWPGLTTPRSGAMSVPGFSYNFPGNYQGEVNFLKKWYSDRLNFIDTNFLTRPILMSNAVPGSAGFQLSFVAPSGASIYYTTNGTDPRLSGGGISDSAQLYGSPIQLGVNVRIRTRSYDFIHRNLTGANKPPLSSPWSGERDLVFGAVSQPDYVAYNVPGQVYAQSFDGLPTAGTVSVGAANPVSLTGTVIALSNPFAFAAPANGPGAGGGLGLGPDLMGWWGEGTLTSKAGASSGDQSTGGIISFGTAGSSQRSLGLLATSSTGPTAVGLKLVNATGQTLDRINLAFTGVLWRQAPNAKTLSFSYSIQPNSAKGFPATNEVGMPSLKVQFSPSPIGSTPTPVDGMNAPNRRTFVTNGVVVDPWYPGSALWLIGRMTDAAGQGQGLAIDDLTFSASASVGPVLSIIPTSAGVEVRWPVSAGGFHLQRSSELGLSALWEATTWPVEQTTDSYRSLIPSNTLTVFLRLTSVP